MKSNQSHIPDTVADLTDELLKELIDNHFPNEQKIRSIVLKLPIGVIDKLKIRPAIWRIFLDNFNCSQVDETNNSLLRAWKIWDKKLNEQNQRVIKVDCERTRAVIAEFKDADIRSFMEKLLTFYCRHKCFTYKQGMNEILAPFLYLHALTLPPKDQLNEENGKGERDYSTLYSYSCASNPHIFGSADVLLGFDSFISKFMTTMFCDLEFQMLQCTFLVFKYLLQYHDPFLCGYLEEFGCAPPELYITPWFLTIFASKTDLDLLCSLWDRYLAENDRFFFFFLALALVISAREELLKTEGEVIPEKVSRLKINSAKELEKIWSDSKKLKAFTPMSYNQRLRFHDTDSDDDNKLIAESLITLESDGLLGISATEIIRHCYGADGGAPSPWKLLVFDCRPKWMYDGGHLPTALHINTADPEFEEKLKSFVSPLPTIAKLHKGPVVPDNPSGLIRSQSSFIAPVHSCSSQNDNEEERRLLSPVENACRLSNSADTIRPGNT
eukprot:GHVL01034967.1.p1 GENE.GHVL01034967.1~~GHVL01034967.1.p1  ORF type:complete len:498 (-),score=65.87 GHVL01034967.1:69-1562(-)